MGRRDILLGDSGGVGRSWSSEGAFFFLQAGLEFLVVLFVSVPLLALVKDGCETDDKQKGDQEDQRVKIGGMRFHVGPFVPAGRKIDDNGYNE